MKTYYNSARAYFSSFFIYHLLVIWISPYFFINVLLKFFYFMLLFITISHIFVRKLFNDLLDNFKAQWTSQLCLFVAYDSIKIEPKFLLGISVNLYICNILLFYNVRYESYIHKHFLKWLTLLILLLPVT